MTFFKLVKLNVVCLKQLEMKVEGTIYQHMKLQKQL